MTMYVHKCRRGCMFTTLEQSYIDRSQWSFTVRKDICDSE